MTNLMLIILATLAQFILGALWYSPLLFGKTWMSIMEVSHYTKEELQKMQKSMMPFYGLQFFLTLITTWVLASNILFLGLSGSAAYFYAGFMWLGFIAPIQISSVVWSSTKRKYWIKQISIMSGMQLVGIMLATFILTF